MVRKVPAPVQAAALLQAQPLRRDQRNFRARWVPDGLRGLQPPVRGGVMRTCIRPASVVLWLSAADTSAWSRRWPCSQIGGKRLVAAFDENGLYDLAINGDTGADIDANEFNAITSDFLRRKL